MNGAYTSTSPALSRKEFIRYMMLMAGAAFTAGHLDGCNTEGHPYSHIRAAIKGAGVATGHKLRDGGFSAPVLTENHQVVIIGGGIAGLAAARMLKQSGVQDFRLLELEGHAGGNAAYGEQAGVKCPWGAHYLPIPNMRDTDLITFLQEAGIITGELNGVPVYNETDLCFDPEERLFIHGRWQEGLLPKYGVSEEEQRQMQLFFQQIAIYRQQRDKKGRYAFDIPLALSSEEEEWRSLDRMTMAAYMRREGFTAEGLLWYIDYCCRDDYGAGIEQVSAWAGIHYFAGRKGHAANAEGHTQLTWPEGNGRLVRLLQPYSQQETLTGALAYQVQLQAGKVWVDYYDVVAHVTKRIVADRCIMATPQFVTQRLLGAAPAPAFTYSPWMVANITLSHIPASTGQGISWDNVFYKSPSLGYVCAQHQLLTQQLPEQAVITYYLPLDQLDPVASRKHALQLAPTHWVQLITDELEKVHPGIHKAIQDINIWIWGHGMIRPIPGFISGAPRLAAQQSKEDRIFFAHSDLSGISIFEEAFYHGNNAARAVIRSL